MKIKLLNMKNLLLVLAMLPVWASSYAMSEPVDSVASKEYSDKYDMLVSRLGVAGVGIETVLDNWAKVDPDNRKMLLARYSYYLTKGQTTVVVDKPGRKYLGNAPLFSLKDSTGANVNYFEETVYDDSLFAMALRNIDRVIDLYPHDLGLQFVKAAALLSYEKDSPDMALVCLDGMADRYYSDRGADWKFEEDTVDDEFFEVLADVQNVVLEFQFLCHVSCFKNGVHAATAFFLFQAGLCDLVVNPVCHADEFVSLFFQQHGGDGAVDASAHGH